VELPGLRSGRGAATASVPIAELYRVATEYERAGRLDEAERLIGYVLAADKLQADTLHLGGIVAFRRGRREEALARMELAVVHGLDTPLYLRNICEVYRSLGRLDEALAAARRAVALAPADPLSLHNLSVIHHQRLELAEGMHAARAALALDPALAGAHFALAEALLLQGEMASGWDEYEWRFRIAGANPPLPPVKQPEWDGAPLPAGTLLLVADQGFGDVIQFMRYIPWVRTRCPRVAVAASTETAPLIAQVAPGIPIVTRWDAAPPFDAYCTLSGLPRRHGTRLESVPWFGPYLQADPAKRAQWGNRLDAMLPRGYRRVGVVWAGRATHNNDRNRSASLAALRPLGELGRTVLVSLQKGEPAAQSGGWFGRAPLVGLGPEIADYADTMAVLDHLDVLVTVDTSVAHLAGAMGRPAWIMLPHAPDWRWLLNRDDSPWYPSVRLWRHGAPGDWAGTVARVAAALRESA
jgi:hypothetical protein